MQLSSSLVLFAAVVSSTFHMATVSAIPYSSTGLLPYLAPPSDSLKAQGRNILSVERRAVDEAEKELARIGDSYSLHIFPHTDPNKCLASLDLEGVKEYLRNIRSQMKLTIFSENWGYAARDWLLPEEQRPTGISPLRMAMYQYFRIAQPRPQDFDSFEVLYRKLDKY
ncbi:hypothetical protein BC835DRAFT_730889 [Cytidiella melzeri]|nr:hypothetical protein BC835DRAFT_730889 [Cytidiella melzeri]